MPIVSFVLVKDLSINSSFLFFFLPYPYPEQQFSDSSKLKEPADHSFKFDENSRKMLVIFPPTLHNTVLTFNSFEIEHFGKHFGKIRKCWLQALKFNFPQCFLPYQIQLPQFKRAVAWS